MPRKCAVKGCESNKPGSKVRKFSFPVDRDMRLKWIEAINRPDYKATENSSICINHFTPDDLEKFHYIDGQRTNIPLELARLKPTRVPTIFPGRAHSTQGEGTSEVQSPPVKKRCDPDTRRMLAIEQQNEKLLQEDKIRTFETFRESYKDHCDMEIFKAHEESRLLILYILTRNNEQNILQVTAQLHVQDDLKIRVFVGDQELGLSSVGFLLRTGMFLTSWLDFKNLTMFLKNNQKDLQLSTNAFIDLARDSLEKALEQASNQDQEFQYEGEVQFIKEQLRLMMDKRNRYDTNTMQISFLIKSISPSAYQQLRSFFILPSPNHLRTIASKLNLAVDNEISNHNYLKQAVKTIADPKDLDVAILIDEIHVADQVVYKAGQIYGHADNNPTKLAKTCQVFMVSSVYGNFKQVIAIVPVLDSKGPYLYELTVKVLQIVQDVGLNARAIITDNHQVNRSLFRKLGTDFNATPEGSRTTYLVRNPINQESNLFLFFDAVHIFKNVRNNWIGNEEAGQTIQYSDFETHEIMTAKWSDLQQIYASEKDLPVRLAHRLTQATLNPDSIEKQKVALVHNLFHESTLNCLKVKGFKDTLGFMDIIKKWWEILNVRSTIVGTLKRNDWQKPFYSDADTRIFFLQDFLNWLETWNTGANDSCLTSDTFNAMLQTTECMIAFIQYSIRERDIPYVLTAKLQTDPIEKRFSRYRIMSGSNYRVSYNNLLESEKKIRLQNILRYGKILDFKVDKEEEGDISESELNKFIPILDSSDYLDQLICDESANLYVCGYTAHVHLKADRCESCVDLLYEGKGVAADDEFFMAMQRGGLVVPSDALLSLFKHMCAIFQAICRDKDMKKDFMTGTHQRAILKKLTMKSIQDDNEIPNYECGLCGKPTHKMFEFCCSNLSNILFKNYSVIMSSEKKKKGRKYNTF